MTEAQEAKLFETVASLTQAVNQQAGVINELLKLNGLEFSQDLQKLVKKEAMDALRKSVL